MHTFKLKGTGMIAFHLGCDGHRDEEGNLCYTPHKYSEYIEKLMDNYLLLFGEHPCNAHSPLIQGNHPELDTSDLLDDANIPIYQSLIGLLQWAIQLGGFDIATAVMALSRFPRQGHLDRARQQIDRFILTEHCHFQIAIQVAQHVFVGHGNVLRRTARHFRDDVFHLCHINNFLAFIFRQ